MKKARMLPSSCFSSIPKLCLLVSVSLAGASAHALEALDDGSMESVSGAGVVYGLDDFSFRFAPTSYIQLTGSAPTTAAATYGWKRGDAYYYGLSFTYGGACGPGTGPGTGTACASPGSSIGEDWYGPVTGHTGTITDGTDSGLQYPIGEKSSPGTSNPYGIVGFASVYNPFILRVYQYPAYLYNGTFANTASTEPTVLEFIGPSKTDSWRWSFWGELLVNASSTSPPAQGTCNKSNTTSCTTGGADFLQSQTLILGSPTASGKTWNGPTDPNNYTAVANRKPTLLRILQSTDSSDPTFMMNYQSSLSGDFRFTVQQTSDSPDKLHYVPAFSTKEGLFFKNVDAYLPLGNLYAQGLTVSGASVYDTTGTASSSYQENGNYVIELTRIPNTTNVYNYIYCGTTGSAAPASCTTDANGYITNPNPDTHGYVRWGNWADPASTPGTTATSLPTATSTANGIYFQDGAGAVTNLGTARVEGLLIQHLKISTLGAGT